MREGGGRRVREGEQQKEKKGQGEQQDISSTSRYFCF